MANEIKFSSFRGTNSELNMRVMKEMYVPPLSVVAPSRPGRHEYLINTAEGKEKGFQIIEDWE